MLSKYERGGAGNAWLSNAWDWPGENHVQHQVVEKCHQQGIDVIGVTKGFSAMHQIVSAMVEGGIDGLADSRMENVIELRNRGFIQPMTMLRLPMLSNVTNEVWYANTSINSEITVIKALAQAAKKLKKLHQVSLMVDVGDFREGILQENVLEIAQQISAFKSRLKWDVLWNAD